MRQKHSNVKQLAGQICSHYKPFYGRATGAHIEIQQIKSVVGVRVLIKSHFLPPLLIFQRIFVLFSDRSLGLLIFTQNLPSKIIYLLHLLT